MPLLDARDAPSYGTIEQDEFESHEEEQLLQNGYDTDGELRDGSILDEAQEGVRKIEAINMTWTTRSLMIAYFRSVLSILPYWIFPLLTGFESIFLMAFCTSLEGQTVASLSAYATSAFSKHSLVSTVLVIQNVVNGKLHNMKRFSSGQLITLFLFSCHKASYGEDCRCVRSFRSILSQHSDLHTRLRANGRFE